jgi:branched-chain amino acid transport system substrate-binding protein
LEAAVLDPRHPLTVAALLALPAAPVALAAADGGARPAPPAGSAAAAPFVIAVGLGGGAFAEQNQELQRGIGLRVGEVNRAGGLLGRTRLRALGLRVDGLSPQALRRRLAAIGADAYVPPCNTDGGLRSGYAAGAAGLLTLNPCPTDPRLGRRYRTYWGIGAAGNAEAGGVAQFLASVRLTRVFSIAGPGLHGGILEAYFTRAAGLQRLRLVGRAKAGSPARLAAAIRRSGATVVYASMPPREGARLAQGLRRGGVKVPIVGPSAMDTRTTLGAARSLQNSYVASYGFVRETAGGRRFRSLYRRSHRRSPVGSGAALGYETVRVVEAAVRRSRSATSDGVQRGLSGGLTVRGVALGDRSWPRGGSHNPVTTVGVAKVFGGRLLPVVAAVPGRIPPP